MRAALRENPDVLVIEDFGSPVTPITLALEAAQSGCLVIGAVAAHSAMEAVNGIIEQAPPESREKVQRALGGYALRRRLAQSFDASVHAPGQRGGDVVFTPPSHDLRQGDP